MTILVTGGCGFIGANFVRYWLSQGYNGSLINLDKLTYAGNPYNLEGFLNNPQYKFVHGDIVQYDFLDQVIQETKPTAIIHFAAESHVDRSIWGPKEFIETNIIGTFNLLEAFRKYCTSCPPSVVNQLRLIHVSTDEVFGSLGPTDPPFTEKTPYAPNSPYSASKAASDHLARAYFHTYQLPIIITNCSNNYGPYQFPEKFIPLMIHHALQEKPIPLYGDGLQIRDWLFVTDHVIALNTVLKQGVPGETYNIGGNSERTNLEVAHLVCETLDSLVPRKNNQSYRELITHVADRPGHDRRYAININKISQELGWYPQEPFESGIKKTAQWYLENQEWVKKIINKDYQKWIKTNYGNRLDFITK